MSRYTARTTAGRLDYEAESLYRAMAQHNAAHPDLADQVIDWQSEGGMVFQFHEPTAALGSGWSE